MDKDKTGRSRRPVTRRRKTFFRTPAPILRYRRHHYAEKFGGSHHFGRAGHRARRCRRLRIGRRIALIALTLDLLAGAVLGLSFAWRVKEVAVSSGGDLRYGSEVLIAYCGLTEGQPMMSFDDADVEKRMMAIFPLLSSVRTVRHLNGRVDICVEEEGTLYYTLHNGNYYLMSADSFKVLLIDYSPVDWLGLKPIYLGLPQEARLRKKQVMTYAWLPYPPDGAGEEVATYELETGEAPLAFAYVEDTLQAVQQSGLWDRLTGLELGDRYDLWLVLDGHIKVTLGDCQDMARKLTQVRAVLEQQPISGLPAVLDVSDPSRVSYRESLDLTLPDWAGR